MSDRSPERPVAPPDQATRDIRLPPLPDRPPPAVPSSGASYVPSAQQDPPAPIAPTAGPAPDSPTDRMHRPDPARDSTLAFLPPPPLQLFKVSVTRRRRRRWPWVLLALVPVVVIVGSGLWLLVLLGLI